MATAVQKGLIAAFLGVALIAGVTAVHDQAVITQAHSRANETINTAQTLGQTRAYALRGTLPVEDDFGRGHSWSTEAAAMRSGECNFGIERDFTRQPNLYVCAEEEEALEERLLLTYATAAEAEQHGPCAHMLPGDESVTVPDESGRFRCEVQSGNRN